jgi:tetratricopeptide (TPR) repeat protein
MRSLPRLARLPAVLLMAGALLLISGAALGPVLLHDPPQSQPGPAPLAVNQRDSAALTSAIAAAQRRLRKLPGDWSTWAQLGTAYVEQARVSADPAYYPKAEEALRRSLALRQNTNWQAMIGMGALANARHDFRAAVDWSRKAQQVNPHNGALYGVLADALTQLGDYPAAADAVQRMLDIEPGIASFTRASYHFEQHGQVPQARTALQRALQEATEPADIAFCRYYLGELAFNNGDLTGAVTQYEQGIAANPNYPMLNAGLAKAHAALGQTTQALSEYDRVVRLLPLPQLLIEYGDLLTAAGWHDKARQQYDLVAVQQQLLADNGVTDHLTAAAFLADHGPPAKALTEAKAEWKVRHSVLVADALAWALHRAGHDAEALDYARNATRLGWRNATFLYHRGAIQEALGNKEQARRDLTDALAINPHFDIRQAPIARQSLTSLGR